MPYQTPRRAVSSATTITVTSTGPSLLEQAIAATTPGTWNATPFSDSTMWTRVRDPREPNASAAPGDPVQDFYWSNPFEDGANQLGHTLLDWGGKIAYDRIGRRVMFAACGANPGGTNWPMYSYQYDKASTYDEATNSWSVERGPIAVNDNPSGLQGIVHMLGNNCIDVEGRRFFKKRFRTASTLVKNLTTGVWTRLDFGNQSSGDREATSDRSGGLDFIPTRGASGMLWSFWKRHSSDMGILVEIDPDTGDWTVLKDQTVFSSAILSVGSTCVYNPRAFGGAGGVLLGGQSGLCWFVRCDDLTVTAGPTPNVNMGPAHGGRVCRDPKGDGWFHVTPATGVIRWANAASSSWDSVASLPTGVTSTTDIVLCPIDIEPGDRYGGIWMLCKGLSNYSGQSNINGFIFRPA